MARFSFGRIAQLALVAPALMIAPPADAGVGDLLVAPTRVVLAAGGRKSSSTTSATMSPPIESRPS
jgi:hypothetical protein